MNRPGRGIRGSGGEKLEQGLSSWILVSAVVALFAVAFAATPTLGSQRFVELTKSEDMEAYFAEDPPDIRLGLDGEILVRRISIPQANLGAYLSQQNPGWDGKVVSLYADRDLSPGQVLLFARALSGMGIERVYYVTLDHKLKLLSSVT